MQIHEVTTPGSLVGQAGVFGRSLSQSLLQKLSPGIAGSERDGSESGGPPATGITGAVMQQLATAQQQLWTQNLLDLMRRTPNRGTGSPGVISIRAVPRAELERLIMAQVSETLRTLSRGRIADFRQLPGLVPVQSRANAQSLVTNIKRGLGQILTTEPNTANASRIKTLWGSVLSDLEQSALQAQGSV
jgi:hypothetical protein